MKIKLSIILILALLLSMISCKTKESEEKTLAFDGATVYTGNNYAVVELCDSESEFSFDVARSVRGEGVIYFLSELTSGTASVSYTYGKGITKVSDNRLFETNGDERINTFGGYVEGSTVSFSVRAEDGACGRILLSFTEIDTICNGNHRFDEGSEIIPEGGNEDFRQKVFSCRICSMKTSCALTFTPDGKSYSLTVEGEKDLIVNSVAETYTSGSLIIIKVRKSSDDIVAKINDTVYHPYGFDSESYDVFYLLMPNEDTTVTVTANG